MKRAEILVVVCYTTIYVYNCLWLLQWVEEDLQVPSSIWLYYFLPTPPNHKQMVINDKIHLPLVYL
jgi:hypothetical protein